MKKKTKKRLKVALWVMALLALLAVVGVSLTGQKPRQNTSWRVPVQVPLSLPPLPDLTQPPSLPPQNGQSYQMEEALPAPSLPLREKEKPAATEREERREGKPRLAFIIDDMGLSGSASARAVRLPAAVTLAYLPYAHNLKEQALQAQQAGHDIMLHMPMEPQGNENPGPLALMTEQDAEEWEQKLAAALQNFDGFVGVNNHMGSRFTAYEEGMRVVAQRMKEEGLFFVDSRTNPNSIAARIMQEAEVPVAGRDVFLDHVVAPSSIQAELARAEQIARRRGYVVVIGHPHAQTLSVLETWFQSASERGFEVVPVRSLAK